jgi:drug/metabolite transporter (DMT)-like permease
MNYTPKSIPLKPQQLAFMALLLLAFIWGYNWVVMKIAVRDAPAFEFAALRNVFGALSIFLVMALRRQSLRPQALWGSALFGLLQSGGSIGLCTWALVQGGAGKTAILTYTMSFWTLLFAWIFLGERLRGWLWLGVGLALPGLVFLLMPFSMTSDLMSKVLAVASGVFWAAASIVLKKLNRRQPVELLSFTAWQMAFGSLPLLLAGLLSSDPPIHWTASFIGALVYNAIPASAVAWLLWLYALKHLPAGLAGLGGLIIPVVGLLAAAWQLGERLQPLEITGMVLILGALALMSVSASLLEKIDEHENVEA